MGEKTVVTWVCDHCKKESEPLKGQVTFNWDYASPISGEWRTYSEDARLFRDQTTRQVKGVLVNGYWGLGNDPRLTPKAKHMWTFCCEEHKQEWLKTYRTEPSWDVVP